MGGGARNEKIEKQRRSKGAGERKRSDPAGAEPLR